MLTEWNNISDAIFHYARLRPTAPAIIEGARTVSYSEFAGLVCGAVAWLRERGVDTDNKVGLLLPNGADHLALSFALMRMGAVPAEIAHDNRGGHAVEMALRFGLDVLIRQPGGAPAPGLSNLEIGPHWLSSLAPAPDDARDRRGAGENRLIAFSSGSTGAPKATLTTHRQRLLRARNYLAFFGGRWSPERTGTYVLTATVGNAGFHEWMMNQFFVGGPVAIMPRMRDAADRLQSLAAFEDAITLVTPNMCRGFLRARRSGELLLPGMRIMIGGGLPLFAAEKQALLQYVTPNFHEVYGASGFGMITGLRPEDIAEKADSVGRPPPGAVLEIADAAGRPLPAGASGRLRCRGDTLAEGFLRAPADPTDAEAFRDGWYYPGDLGRLDAEGFLHLRGRIADRILRGGQEICPADIEEAILAHPAVREVAVVGRPRISAGEDVVAYVVSGEGLDREELARHCRERLARSLLPDRIYLAKDLPKLPNGKMDRRAIKAFALRQSAQGRRE